jgi:homoserine dehydrogenase
VTEALARSGVSIDSFLQRSVHEGGGLVPIVLTTQPALESKIEEAMGRIAQIEAVVEKPRMIRIAMI